MGLKDVINRLTGRESSSRRGARGRRNAARQRDDVTVQIRPPQAPAPGPPTAPPQPTPYPVTGPPPTMPPPAPYPVTPPVAAPPPPTAPQTPSDLNQAQTQIVQVPKLDAGPVTGVLVAIDGDLEGEVYTIRHGETKLGRAESCDIVLPSVKISREHATVICDEGMFAIAPLADRNPTWVNDDQIEGCELSDGDLVRMGTTRFRFRIIEGL